MLQHEDAPELEQCAACRGSGKNRRPFTGRCFRCNGDKKLTPAQVEYFNRVSKLIKQ